MTATELAEDVRRTLSALAERVRGLRDELLLEKDHHRRVAIVATLAATAEMLTENCHAALVTQLRAVANSTDPAELVATAEALAGIDLDSRIDAAAKRLLDLYPNPERTP